MAIHISTTPPAIKASIFINRPVAAITKAPTSKVVLSMINPSVNNLIPLLVKIKAQNVQLTMHMSCSANATTGILRQNYFFLHTF